MNFEKLKNIPESMLTEVTEMPEHLKEKPTPIEEALKGAEHTKIQTESTQPTTTPIVETPKGGTSVGSLVGGEMALNLLDAVLPGLIVAGFHAMNVQLAKSDMQLTAKEKEVIAPVLQKCLDTININFNNPWVMLGVTTGIVYGGKITEKGLVSWIDKMNEKNAATKETFKVTERKPVYEKPVEQELYNRSMFDVANSTTQNVPNVFDTSIKKTELIKNPEDFKPKIIIPEKKVEITERQIEYIQKKRRWDRIQAVEYLTDRIEKGKDLPSEFEINNFYLKNIKVKI